MARRNAASRGQALAARLAEGVTHAERAPVPGARALPVLEGVTPQGRFPGAQENVLVRLGELLAASQRVFRFGDAVVFEVAADGGRLHTLLGGGQVDAGAVGWLANLVVCQHGGLQFPPPPALVAVALRAAPVTDRLPCLRQYARRPVYDDAFVLRGPGWHADAGILVHGPAVEPWLGPVAAGALPPHLERLLQNVPFRGPADRANLVGALVTGLLAGHFVSPTKPIILIDGNQPDVGKSTLARVLGGVLDGHEAHLVSYTANDDELQKVIGTFLKAADRTVLALDNAKTAGGGRVSSAVLEANSMAPEVVVRILGQSENRVRPNDFLWVLTMNDVRASPDLVSRGLPVRLAYDGDARARPLPGPDSNAYAREHRVAILGELAGMVERWKQAGRPAGRRPHRCRTWAEVVGGVLVSNGLGDFLGNLDEAAAEFDITLDDLAALAEAAVRHGGGFVEIIT
jgi:hypothetical protein